jgi:hypothetical protein
MSNTLVRDHMILRLFLNSGSGGRAPGWVWIRFCVFTSVRKRDEDEAAFKGPRVLAAPQSWQESQRNEKQMEDL